MIEFRNVSKHYPPDVVAVDSVSAVIEPGEFVSIVGRSGTGKTTLMKMLIAEESPTIGSIIVGGWDITRIHPSQKPMLRRQIGVVFQDFKLLPKKTAAENVAFALEVCGVRAERVRSIVEQVLKIVGLEHNRARFPRQLSGGEQQRVAIARSLVHAPKILVADEPTGNLDSIHAQDITELLMKINTFGTTLVLVTHNREVVNRIKKRVITLDNGRIISDQKTGKYLL